MFRSGDVTIRIEIVGPGKGLGKVRYSFEVTLDSKIVAKSDELECPRSWSLERVAEEVAGWLVGAGDELRQEFGWTFDEDDMSVRLDSYDDGRETRYNVESIDA